MGPDCYIGEDARIEGTVLWSSVNIGAGGSLKQCVVSSNTRIGENDQVINRVITPDQVRIAEVEGPEDL
jgi:NDP-sugar pyrophosphorylase family protein